MQGKVMGGQQPIQGAHVYLFAANTTGYGGPGIAASTSNASVSLLSAASTGLSDSVGAYVLTGSGGNFSISGDYSCTPNTQVYLYALGGNPGLTGGTNNLASGLLAALGNCPSAGNFLTATPFIVINEVSTVATAYAFAGFATDATHVSSSGTALAKTGIANAFANAANLETISTGAALATTPAGNGTVPQATINSLANILAACINTTGAVTGPTNPTACYTLLTTALSGGTTGTQPTDTAAAAINMAHNPAANIAALYALPTGTPPFGPALTAQPNDFTISLRLTVISGCCLGAIAIDGSGNAWITYLSPLYGVFELSSTGSILSPGATGYTGVSGPGDIAIDQSGNIWVANQITSSVTKLSSAGSVLSGASGYPSGGSGHPYMISIDGSGNVWLANTYVNNNGTVTNGSVTKLSSSGSILSGANGYAGGGISPLGIAIDGSGNAWVVTDPGFSGNGSVIKLSSSGSVLSGSTGYTGGGISDPTSLAIDNSGNAWVINYPYFYTGGGRGSSSVSELSNLGSTLSGASGFTGGGLNGPTAIALDGSGNAWMTLYTYGVVEFSNSGSVLSGANAYAGGGGDNPFSVAVDGSGNVWAVYLNGTPVGSTYVVQYIGAATPVITPIAAGLPSTPTSNGTSNLGTRP
jgi:hypothetical protein